MKVTTELSIFWHDFNSSCRYSFWKVYVKGLMDFKQTELTAPPAQRQLPKKA